MTGSWQPAATWHRIHGDGKSTTCGRWHLETLQTSGDSVKTDNGEVKTINVKYRVRMIEDKSVVYTKTYDDEPSFGTIVADLKSYHNVA
jgi:hypothetical protein